MMKNSFVVSFLFLVAFAGTVYAQAGTNIYESDAKPSPTGEIDRIIFSKLSSMGIEPKLCSDAVFVRRAYLDVIGTLPTADEAREFIDDPDVQKKRVKLIDRLLERPEFADYWAMKWGDVLRIKAEFPVNLWPNAAQAYHRWVRASISENKPYDQFARELLTSSGSNFRVGPVNFYRAIQNKTPEGIANTVAMTFMGTRTDNWPDERLVGMAAFFSQVGYKPTSEWKEECVFWDPLKGASVAGNTAPGTAKVGISALTGKASEEEEAEAETEKAPTPPTAPLVAIFPDGSKLELPSNQDPREIFADWLITDDNPWFMRSIANRVWGWLMGRGIIHEVDDIRDDNPPSNPELLAFLEKDLIASGYDLKRLYRLILTSSAYQFSAVPHFNTPEARANFASYEVRRLDAEVLIDAINKVTGTSDLYTSPIPEPFTYIPADQPAIAIADGSITSPFLALFGRSARATGMASERNNNPVSSAQWLHMLNSSHIQSKLDRSPKLKAIFDSGNPAKEIADELYLTILSRKPTTEEIQRLLEYGRPGAKKQRTDLIDISWALINSTEFLYRH